MPKLAKRLSSQVQNQNLNHNQSNPSLNSSSSSLSQNPSSHLPYNDDLSYHSDDNSSKHSYSSWMNQGSISDNSFNEGFSQPRSSTQGLSLLNRIESRNRGNSYVHNNSNNYPYSSASSLSEDNHNTEPIEPEEPPSPPNEHNYFEFNEEQDEEDFVNKIYNNNIAEKILDSNKFMPLDLFLLSSNTTNLSSSPSNQPSKPSSWKGLRGFLSGWSDRQRSTSSQQGSNDVQITSHYNSDSDDEDYYNDKNDGNNSDTYSESNSLSDSLNGFNFKEDSAAARALHFASQSAAFGGSSSASKGSLPIPTTVSPTSNDHLASGNVEIQQGHAQYALTYGMMLGIRVTTGRQDIGKYNSSYSQSATTTNNNSFNYLYNNLDLSYLEMVGLRPEDFEQCVELLFKPEGNTSPPFPTPPHKLSFSFTFKDYNANVFKILRSLSNIDEADYMLSLAGEFNYIEFLANSKSGQFFFYSHDRRYMIKTLTKQESKLLRKMLPAYFTHLSSNPHSFLIRFYGLHRVKMKSLRSKTYFVVMSSVFYTKLPIEIKYDLKGSTIGRFTPKDQCKKGSVQKDLNFVQNNTRINLQDEYITIFHDTLVADVNFLKSQNIMDYSLLIGIHHIKRKKSKSKNSIGEELDLYNDPNLSEYSNTGSLFQSYHGGIRSYNDQGYVFFMGIIDILQEYNIGKHAETFFKSFSHNKQELSSVDPELYAERFLNFILSYSNFDPLSYEKMKKKNHPHYDSSKYYYPKEYNYESEDILPSKKRSEDYECSDPMDLPPLPTSPPHSNQPIESHHSPDSSNNSYFDDSNSPSQDNRFSAPFVPPLNYKANQPKGPLKLKSKPAQNRPAFIDL